MTHFASTYLLPPVSLVVLLALAVLWLAGRAQRPRRGWVRNLCIALAIFALLATLPAVPKGLSWPLGTLVPDWDKQGRPAVGAIVVPTGGSFIDPTGRRWPNIETLQRVSLGASLAAETGLPLAVSGGSPEEEPYSEAALAVDFLGLDRNTVLLDTLARNTHENARAFSRLLQPQNIGSVVVVTNGIHMARMSATLRAAGFQVYAYSLGISMDSPMEAVDFVPSNRAMGYFYQVTSGYAGILYYLARGWISVDDLLAAAHGDADVAPSD